MKMEAAQALAWLDLRDGNGMRLKDYRQIPNAAFETNQISGDGYRVLAAVQFFDRNGLNGRGCDAAAATIAARALCDLRTTQRWLRKLSDLGLLSVETRTGRGKTNIYHVVFDHSDQELENSQKDDTGAALSDAERVTENAQKGDRSVENSVPFQFVDTPKDTEGYTAKRGRICSGEPAPFLENGAATPEKRNADLREESIYSDRLSQAMAERFPVDAPRFKDHDGRINVGGFLAWADRKAQRGQLGADGVNRLLDVAELVVDHHDCGSPEYGAALRLLYSMEYDEMARGQA
jgi:hypothetical protein